MSKKCMIVFAVIVLGGCATLGLSTMSLKSPDVLVPIDNAQVLKSSIICLVPFSSKENIPPSWLEEISRSYVHSLQIRNIGASVRFFDAYRDFLSEKKSCHLLMEGSVDRFLFTGGGQPQEIILSVQIKDLSTDMVIFSLRQEGIARPGEDVDLYWTTVEGQRSATPRKLVDAMGEQFGKLVSEEILKSSRRSSY